MRRAAQTAAQAAARRTGSSAPRWWLTIVRGATCCARCAVVLRQGSEMVYRHTPRESLCVACAQNDPDARTFKPSVRWERERSRSRTRRRK